MVSYGMLPATMGGRTRHVFFCYVGEMTPPLTRGRAAVHAPHLAKYFQGLVGMLPTLTSAEELAPAHINAMLTQAIKGGTTVTVL